MPAIKATNGSEGQALRDHLADIAHELRTPATIALGLAERLTQDHGLLPDARRDVDRIAANLRVIQTHVQSLLAGARIEMLEERPGTMQDVAGCFRRTAQDFLPLAAYDGVRLTIECPTRLDAAVAPGHLTVVLSNLLVNAIRSTPRNGLVRCSLSGGEHLCITVADSGHGIPPHQRRRVLQRFASDPGTPHRDDGAITLGLGLEIVHRIVTSYGGRIMIEDSPEGGALVTVTLPGISSNGPDRATPSPSPVLYAANGAAANGAGPPLVAVLTDEGDRSSALIDALGRGGGREIVPIDNKVDALGVRPDAVVMAHGRTSDAHALVTALREDPDHDDVPLLALVATTDVRQRLELLRLGVDDVVDPSVSGEELRGRIDRRIARSRRDGKRRADAARFRRAFHDAAIGMGLATVSGAWEEVNPALCAIAGLSESELLHRHVNDLDDPDEPGDRDAESLAELLAGRTRGFQIDKRWLVPSGETVWVRISMSAERDAVGAASGLVIQVEDITITDNRSAWRGSRSE